MTAAEKLAEALKEAVKEDPSIHEMYLPYLDPTDPVEQTYIDGHINFVTMAEVAIEQLLGKDS